MQPKHTTKTLEVSQDTSRTGVLAERHLRELRDASGISEDVIAERGYRTVTDEDELIALGFADYQARPGLLIPLHGPDGSNSRYALKPNEPRVGKDGRARKYDYPAGQSPILDVPPRCLDQIGDASVPLVFTEGAKKADCLAGMGYCAVNIWGVFSWAHRDHSRPAFDQSGEASGLLALTDWQHIPLDGRLTYLEFDSDAWRNAHVALALRRLANWLTRQGALVYIVHLPDEPDGSKNGADDYTARYGDQAHEQLMIDAESWGSMGMVRQLEARVRELEEERAAIFKVLHNADLTAGERIVAVSAVCQTQSRMSRGHQGPIRVVVDAPKNPANPNDQERVGLAADVGLSKNTVRRALDRVFADDAPIVKRTVYSQNADGAPRAHIELESKCMTGTPGMLWALSRHAPPKPEPKVARPRCPIDEPHPHKFTETCTVTGLVEEHERKLPGTQNEYQGEEPSSSVPLSLSSYEDGTKMSTGGVDEGDGHRHCECGQWLYPEEDRCDQCAGVAS
ncbi:MAG: DUF3854 domain-containing protein [Gemmatimonadota bacterium]